MFKGGQFHRTSPQEHNSTLVVLVAQLQDSLQKIPALVIKATRDSPGTALSSSTSTSTSLFAAQAKRGDATGAESVLSAEMEVFMTDAIKRSDELSAQLLQPLVEALSTHFREGLAGLLREGLRGPKSGAAVETSTLSRCGDVTCCDALAARCDDSLADLCVSLRAVETVVQQFPLALECYVKGLPRCHTGKRVHPPQPPCTILSLC